MLVAGRWGGTCMAGSNAKAGRRVVAPACAGIWEWRAVRRRYGR